MPSVPHVSTVIARPWREVYDYAADPANLPHWAAGLSSSALVEGRDGWWSASSPMGTVGAAECSLSDHPAARTSITGPVSRPERGPEPERPGPARPGPDRSGRREHPAPAGRPAG